MHQYKRSALQPLPSSFQLATSMQKSMESAGNADHEYSCISHALLHLSEAPHSSSFVDANAPPSIQHAIKTSSISSLFSTEHSNSPPQSNPFLTTMVANLSCSSPMSKEQESSNSQSNNIATLSVASHDDGSVASRLLSSFTKSMPSTSLQLANCKEVLRETPFQKSLKLKRMTLQHCAEALGMESSNSASPSLVCANINSQNAESDQNTIQNPSVHQFVVLPTVGSFEEQPFPPLKSSLSPDRGASFSKMAGHFPPKYSRCTSFPPPLSHTLPSSSSTESLSISLRPLRKDGRLILKEVMSPSKHYFHASRRDGRLILDMLLRDTEEEEEVFYRHYNKKGISRDIHEVEDADELEHSTTEELSIKSQVALICREEAEAGHETVEIAASTAAYAAEEEARMIKASLPTVEFQKADHFAESPDSSADMDLSTRLGIAPSSCLLNDTSSVAEAINFQCCVMSTSNHHCSNPMSKDVNTDINSTALALNPQAMFRNPEFTLQKAECFSLRSLYTCAPSTTNMEACALNRFRLYFPSGHHDMARFVEPKDGIIWDSNLMPRRIAHQNPKAGGLREGKVVTHRFVVQVLEQYANTMMTKVPSVKDCNTWPLGSKPLSEHSTTTTCGNLSSVLSGSSVKNAPIYSTLDGLIMDKKMNVEECVSNLKHSSALCRVRPSRLVGLVHDQPKAASICCAVRDIPSSSLNYSACALVNPAPPYHVQGDDRPSHLNCKEPPVYHRNHFGVRSFMKPNSCIATRS